MAVRRIHHLDCATFRPYGRRFVDGDGGLVATGTIVTHCLLVETDTRLVLVDSGFGTADLADPKRRLGTIFILSGRPVLDPEQTALRQVARLGYRPEDVADVLLTHLDVDHAGGLADFPGATVHVFETEHRAAMAGDGRFGGSRYRPFHWGHGPRWALHRPEGEPWFGFECARNLDRELSDFVLVSLPGHTLGHAGVAVRRSDAWLLHAGDSYMDQRMLDPQRPRCPTGLAIFQWGVAADRAARWKTLERLRALASRHAAEVRLFPAHDAREFNRLRGD
ncbi:MAG: MBL fold metallo-hydrolase [Planctomycetes bacterium]|nr:MBL fold metallo-hydrolase [Planctomycetota bacterium]